MVEITNTRPNKSPKHLSDTIDICSKYAFKICIIRKNKFMLFKSDGYHQNIHIFWLKFKFVGKKNCKQDQFFPNILANIQNSLECDIHNSFLNPTKYSTHTHTKHRHPFHRHSPDVGTVFHLETLPPVVRSPDSINRI